PGSDCIKWERKLKKGGARCKHRPPPKMTHQQDLTKSRFHRVDLNVRRGFKCGNSRYDPRENRGARSNGNPQAIKVAVEEK
ncbi:hypothetical protein, partial [Limosilactobacillus fermentum]|uniref:hypothetical protein n=1 Tax=Limosilactobacillus fermentum TaxID=1613 RepID=UPI0019D55BBE